MLHLWRLLFGEVSNCYKATELFAKPCRLATPPKQNAHSLGVVGLPLNGQTSAPNYTRLCLTHQPQTR